MSPKGEKSIAAKEFGSGGSESLQKRDLAVLVIHRQLGVTDDVNEKNVSNLEIWAEIWIGHGQSRAALQ